MTDKINDGGPAFPMPYTTADNGPPGMSLRDWFAGMAMQGAISDPEFCAGHPDGKPLDTPQRYREALVRYAYNQADAMLEARKP